MINKKFNFIEYVKYLSLFAYIVLCLYGMFFIKKDHYYAQPTCNWLENSRRKGNKVLIDMPPTFVGINMMLKRYGQEFTAQYFVPDSDIANGIFYSNLFTSITTNQCFKTEGAMIHIEFCINQCSQLKKYKQSYKQRYENNIDNTDSLLNIVQEITYYSGVYFNSVEFRLGGFIDVISKIDSTNLSDDVIDHIINTRLSITDMQFNCEDKVFNNVFCSYTDRLLSIIDEIKINSSEITPVTDKKSGVKVLKAFSGKQYNYQDKLIINKYINEAKKIRNEIVGL